MYIATNEFQAPAAVLAHPQPGKLADHYRHLSSDTPDRQARERAAAFLREELGRLQSAPCELPEAPGDLMAWMEANTRRVHATYAEYLQARKAGGARHYFGSRAHALYFLRSVAPTKLVDGSWLYGLVAHWRNPRFAGLVRTYVEELGEGDPDKNHVTLYRALLARYGLDPLDDLQDELHRQGLIQLALGWNAEAFLPEVVGFNLAYEQLPLHLLITAYELNELGLDPYYFTLHVTVDNSDTGHARRACQAVLDTLPRLGDGSGFWRRVREGSKLADAGMGTTAVIEDFNIDAEVVRIFARKSRAGSGAHSDYCRVAGRSINDWLSVPQNIPGLLQALQQAGWIRRGEPPEASRFWRLLQGERSEMFGVFSGYELQVIHDWIRGEAAADGRPYDAPAGAPGRLPSFRATARRPGGDRADPAPVPLDADLSALDARLRSADPDDRLALQLRAMSPAHHWTPAGLHATRMFRAGRFGG